MLSKVLSAREASAAMPAIFPCVAVVGVPSGVVNSRGSGDVPAAPGKPAETAALRETIQTLEKQHAAAKRDAFDAGRQQGDQQARSELQPVLERLNASIAETVSMRADLRRRAERDVVRFALLIAKRVLHREVSMDENALTAVARVAFERLTRSESYTVTVHPRFAAAIQAALPGTYASRVRIDPDPDCALGTLVIHSPEGVIDASVDAQMDEIGRGLTDRLANS
jgi:flagellar assembly protein FliH